jgi:hypothetical protein
MWKEYKEVRDDALEIVGLDKKDWTKYMVLGAIGNGLFLALCTLAGVQTYRVHALKKALNEFQNYSWFKQEPQKTKPVTWA